MSTTRSLNESDPLDVKTIPSAIGAGIDELRSQFLLSPKRKLAETGDGGPQPPPTEKRNRGDETEQQQQQQQPPLGKQQQGGGGGCECKGGECECEGDMSMDDEIGAGTLGSGGGARDEDSSDDELGRWGNMLDDPEIAKIWSQPHPVLCCSHPFTDLDFKHDTQLYNDLKDFCEKAVKYFEDEKASLEDIEEVTSCHASCAHRIVTLKSKDHSGQAWEMVLRGCLPPQGFAEAKPREFYILEHCRV